MLPYHKHSSQCYVETMAKNTSKLRSNLISKAKTFLNRITLFNLNSGAAIPRRALNELSEGKDDTSEDTEDTVN